MGGAKWCGRTGQPPAGAALWAVNNLTMNVCTMWLVKLRSPEALCQLEIHQMSLRPGSAQTR